MKKYKTDLVGKVFGRLVALKWDEEASTTKASVWKCQCSCGKVVNVLRRSLVYGATKSCGCLQKENRIVHGWSKTHEYESWLNMKSRCYNDGNKSYKDYGGRGILVCESWMDETNGFLNFLEDLGLCPEGYSLERLDVNGHYCKENCKWEVLTEQARNQRIKTTNSSGVRGASFRKRNSKWYTTITVEKVPIFLGEFNTIEEAAIARVEAELKYFGKTYNSVREDIWDKVKHIFEENSDEE